MPGCTAVVVTKRRARALIALATLAVSWLLTPWRALAFSPRPKTDNAIAAWQASTGATLWLHAPQRLSQALLELYRARLVVHLDGELGERIDLDPKNGSPLSPPEGPATAPLAKSHAFDQWSVVLANGWRLANFSPGTSQVLSFEDSSGRSTWKLATNTYPESVAAYGDSVFWSRGSADGDGIVHAVKAGAARETWRFDANGAVSARAQPLTSPRFAIVEGQLFVQAREHLFIVDPGTGSLIQHLDLAKLSGVPWQARRSEAALYGGGLSAASLVQDARTIVVAYERRVIALDAASRKLLWHRDPGCFPSLPLPILHDGTLYLTAASSTDGPKPAAPSGATTSNTPAPASPATAPAPPLQPWGPSGASAPRARSSCACSASSEGSALSSLSAVLFALLKLARRSGSTRLRRPEKSKSGKHRRPKLANIDSAARNAAITVNSCNLASVYSN